MPVTLCFIKDKHKVMEHKILLETYFAGLLQKVEWQIQEYEDTATDTLTLCRLCVDYLQEILGELKTFIISYPFASTEEEIHFFKELKPLLASKIIYYNTVYKIEVRFPSGSEDVQRDYLLSTGFQSRSSGTWRSTSTTARKPPTWTDSISCVGSLTYKSSWTVSITKQTHSSAPVTTSR
jgi:hypothetical protein